MERAFEEKAPERWSAERERLLANKIADLGLRIEGSYLETLIQRLYTELGEAGIALRPKVYLSDEWACPDGVPIIGIPFYLADPRLARIEDEMSEGIEAETEDEILSYLRHEAGHTFSYAYKLYEDAEWLAIFGDYGRPYHDNYVPQPFSHNYVRHIPGWYAQKHPDEDFAETFAVWLTPGSRWRDIYKDWGCYDKLLYVDKIVKHLGQQPPKVSGDDYDLAAEAMVYSVHEHYEKTRSSSVDIPSQLDDELQEVFRAPYATPVTHALRADDFLRKHQRSIVRNVTYWTGLYDVVIKALVKHCVERAAALDLSVDPKRSEQTLINFTVLVTALCMNKLYKGEFVLK